MRFGLRAVALLLALTLTWPAAAESPKSLFKKGRDAEARQDYERAYDYFYQAYQQKPTDIRYRAAYERLRFMAAASHVHRGQILRDGGKLQEALAEFQRALQIDPSSFVAQQEIDRTRKMIEEAAQPHAAATPPRDAISRRLQSAAGPVELAPISQTPITLHVSEDARLVYETVGKLAGINVLFDPDYTSRRISVDLNGVTLDQALDVVSLESRTFWRPVTPNTIFVAQDTRQKRTELEQNVVKTFYLSNLSQPTEIQEVVNALRTILEITRVQPITAQGAIVVRGTPDQVALAEKLVQDFDKAPAEVVIDVAIMQVTRDKIRDLGIQPPGSTSVALQGNITPATSTTTGGTTTTTPSTATSTGTINLNNFAHLNATDFVVTIPQATANFLLTDSDTKIIQKPQLRASDGQKATLKIGDRIPVATGSFQPGIGGIGINPLVNTQFQYTDVGVNIDITPRVHAAREVSLKMTLEISSVTSHVNIGGIDQPVIGQRKVDHEIRLKEGEVNLLGGIFEDQDIKSLAGIPGLAQIPLFRYLFSSQHTETRRNEIVFLLVPHIVRSHDIDEMNLRAIDAGTGSAIELRLTPAAAGNGGAGGGATTQAGRIGGANRTTGTTASGGSQMPQSIPAQAAPAGAATQEGGTSAAQRGAQPAFGAAQGASRSAGTATEAAGTQLLFDPPIINQPAGSTFTVNVVLSGAQDVYSAPIQLQYDPARLQLLNVSNGSFLSRDGQVVVLTHREDANNGSAQISASRPPGAPGVSGDGPVYTLTFLAKSSGNTTLTMTRAMLRNPSNQSMPVTAGQAQVSIK